MRATAITAAAIAMTALLASWPSPSQVPAPTVERAYTYFQQHQYIRTYNTLAPHMRRPRRLRTDFMFAVSLCNIAGFKEDGLRRLREIKEDYLLSPAMARDANAWITACTPRTASLLANDEAGSSSAGLTARPGLAIADADSGAIHPSARMSPLQTSFAYLQSDLYSRSRPSAESCSRLCRADAACKAMTFVEDQRICWIKGSIPNSASSAGYTSARKLPDRNTTVPTIANPREVFVYRRN